MTYSILLPMFVHVIWVALLYALLTLLRAPNVWGFTLNEDRRERFEVFEGKTSANLSNQFEWPVLFYAICAILISKPDALSSLYICMAWIFVLGRVLHSGVQILTGNIRLRGIIFTINFSAVLGMWVIFAINILKS